jgi:hypothetical protein
MACSFLTRLFHRRRPSASTAPPLIHSAATTSLQTALGIGPIRPLSPILLPTDFTPVTIPATAGPSNDHTANLQLMREMAGQGFTSLAITNIDLHPDLVYTIVDQAFQDLEGYLSTRAQTETVNGSLRFRFCIVDFRTSPEAANALDLHPQLTYNGQSYPVSPFFDANMNNTPGDTLFEPLEQRDRAQAPPPQGSTVTSTPSLERRPRKRLRKEPPKPPKPQCKVCFTELEGLYSTPCRKCKSPRCYDCLKREFGIAMTDLERMPVVCCGTVVHYEVVNKLLPTAEIEAYKLRFDEQNTPDPLYCPVPTCSTFIPPRLISKHETKVHCLTCSVTICTKCKQQANDNHVCAKSELREAILATFHYKICPKCGTGVMKMFGCPHVRCQCGAHWCWDCQRPMNACYRKPCRVAREDGQHSENDGEDSDSDDEVETLLPEQMVQAEQTTTTTGDGSVTVGMSAPVAEVVVVVESVVEATPMALDSSNLGGELTTGTIEDGAANVEDATEAITPTAEDSDPQQAAGEETTGEPATANTEPAAPETENLDDPDLLDWEAESINFGDEPNDESHDVWGCRHQFRDFEKQHIPEFWQAGVDPKESGDLEVGCLSCFKKAKVWETKEDEKPSESSTEEKAEKDDAEPTIPEENLPKKKATTTNCAFECQLCGVIYCGTCKKAAIKKMRKERRAADDD